MASRRTAATALKRSPEGEPLQVKAAPRRVQDPEGVRRSILEIASAEFAANGLSGARVDEIAAKTSTSKRMIYYYFGDKDGLYRSVLEQAYARIRQIEAELNLSHLDPEEAIAALVGFTFDYQNSNEDFIRLVMVENVHRGEHLAKSNVIRDLNVSVIDTLRDIYARGCKAGVFRKGLDPIDIHMTISALCFFNVANRATFSQIFSRDMQSPEALAKRRKVVIETVMRYMK